jgi:type I restriction enzyme S subunit
LAIVFQSLNLGELVSIKTGKLNSNAADPKGKYPFFTCSRETFRTNTFTFDTECVILAGNNATADFPLKYFNGKFDAYQRTYIIKPLDEGVLSTKYLYYALRLKLRELKSSATGAATKFLTLKILKQIEIRIPPLQIQNKMAGILSAFDDSIDNSQERICILQSMIKAIYREWFVNSGSTYHNSEFLAPFESNGPQDMPLPSTFGDLCELRKDHFRELEHSHLPLVDLARMPSKSLAPNSFGLPSELTTSRIVFTQGDSLFGSIRCYLHKVVAVNFSGVTNTSVLVLRPKFHIFRTLVSAIASDDETIRWAEKHSTGLKMPVIKWTVFQTMPISIPSIAIVTAFERLAGPMLDQIGVLANQIQTMEQTHELLLPRLLTGLIDLERY